MKKIVFTLIFLFNFNILFAKDFTVIKGQVIENNNNYIKIVDLKSDDNIIINGKFSNLEKGDFVKIIVDKNKKILEVKEINLKSIRERIRKIGKFKSRRRYHKFNRNKHHRHN